MIHSISAMPAGGDLQGIFAAASGGNTNSPFLALFAQAIATQSGTDAATGQLFLADGVDAAGGKAGLGLPHLFAEDEAPVDPALLETDGMSMMSLLGSPSVIAMVQEVFKAKGGLADSGGEEVALQIGEMGGKGGMGRKNLPDSLAVLAAQWASANDGKVEEVAEGRLPAGLLFASDGQVADAGALVALPMVEKALPAGTSSSGPAITLAGQENVLLVARSQTMPHQERPVLAMQAGLGGAAWQQELGDKLVWMAGRQNQMAELVLNPPSLGAVEVRLNLTGSEASAQFFSANPNVRDVIEAALPKLREMMGGAGIALGEAMVSDQSFHQQGRSEQAKSGDGNGFKEVPLIEAAMPPASTIAVGKGLLDYFA